MDRKLSDRERAVLEYIRQAVSKRGYPPSVREIGQAVGISSSSTVHSYLSRLEKHGCLRRDPAKPRAIELLDPWSVQARGITNVAMVPRVGKVTAGIPITAIEELADFYPLPKAWIGEGPSFLLSVQGDSMYGAGIRDGDMVIVRQQLTANDGDIVVALTPDGEATVKRFFRESPQIGIRLQPENDMFAPLYLKEVQILGIVKGLIRLNVS